MSLSGRCTSDADASAGSALVVVLMGLLVLTALGLAAVLLATADTLAASNQRDAKVAFYAAESGVELAAAELVRVPGWDAILSGAARSAFADGSPADSKLLPDGSSIRPDQVASQATCGNAAGCSAAAREAVTEDRPWGRNNPLWRPYRFGFVNGSGSGAGVYVVVLVADDPAETDDDPQRDGMAPENPGAGVLVIRAEAFGPAGARRSVEAVIARITTPSGVAAARVLSWREVR
jgi:hypothetical protein